MQGIASGCLTATSTCRTIFGFDCPPLFFVFVLFPELSLLLILFTFSLFSPCSFKSSFPYFITSPVPPPCFLCKIFFTGVSAMDQITIYTLNTKGLNVPEKRRMLLNDLKRSKADVAFIQETHFKTGAPMCLKNRYFPTTYHATNPSAKSKGVSILISGNVPWTCRDTRIDTEGRYVFLKGLIGDVLVTLATVYAPNDRQDIFISKTLNELLSFAEGQLMLGGDFNVPLCPSVDTSNGTSSLRRGVHNRITKTLHETRLIDVWRLLHAGERDYTFFSSPHKSYSCIDLFLLPHNQLEAIDKVDIGTITWSDHAPITLKYSLSRTATTKSRFWRLNESLLQDPTVLADVTKELKFYFQTNDIDNCDPGILWEAHKSVIRGILIKHGAHIKREREKQLLILLQKTHDLEKTHKQNRPHP